MACREENGFSLFSNSVENMIRMVSGDFASVLAAVASVVVISFFFASSLDWFEVSPLSFPAVVFKVSLLCRKVMLLSKVFLLFGDDPSH